MQYAIAKLHFRDPPSPESLGEGLVWVNAPQVPIYFDLCFSKDRADKVIKNHKLSKCPRVDRAGTGTYRSVDSTPTWGSTYPELSLYL